MAEPGFTVTCRLTPSLGFILQLDLSKALPLLAMHTVRAPALKLIKSEKLLNKKI